MEDVGEGKICIEITFIMCAYESFFDNRAKLQKVRHVQPANASLNEQDLITP